MKSTIHQVAELLGLHPMVGRLYTGKDRSYKRSIYRIEKFFYFGDMPEDRRIDFKHTWRRDANLDKKSKIIVVSLLSLDGRNYDPGENTFEFPKKYFLGEYRLAKPEEIKNAAAGTDEIIN